MFHFGCLRYAFHKHILSILTGDQQRKTHSKQNDMIQKTRWQEGMGQSMGGQNSIISYPLLVRKATL